MTDNQMTGAVWQAALAGLLHGVEQLTRLSNLTLPESLKRPLEVDTLARQSLAQRLEKGSALEQTSNQADWPYLRSVFSQLSQFGGTCLLRPKRLAFDADTLLPVTLDHEVLGQTAASDCAAMGADLNAALREAAATGEPRRQIEALQNVLQVFGWAVAAARDLPEVSLFSQTRATAALATALAADQRSTEWCNQAGGEAEICALMVGDVNGVQDFIYSLASRGAARTLRGRSFYVQLLTEVVAEYILDWFKLPLTNLLYAGGGNFYLLIGAEQSRRLDEVRADVTRRLNIAHEGSLNLTLGATVVKAHEFQSGQFARVWEQLHGDVGQHKRRPFEALNVDEMFKLSGVELGAGGDEDATCSICGSEKQRDEYFEPEEFGWDTVRKCEFCQSLERLGNDLAKATHLVWLKHSTSDGASTRMVRRWQDGLENFGVQFFAVNTANKPDDTYLRIHGQPALARVTLVDAARAKHADQLQQELSGVPTLYVPRLFAQLVARDENGNPLTFDDIGEQTALQRWGVLRADVDNLGKLFQRGFTVGDQNRLTLGRVMDLSFALRLLFEGWLPRLAESKPELADTLYLQYAGGDDVFMVGAWNALPRFALLLRQTFQQYVGGNPSITFSVGISLADLRYPLYQAAEDADKAERAAKRHGKNAITLLNQTLTWDEFAVATEWADRLLEWAKVGQIRQALLQTLLEVGMTYRADRDSGKPHYGRWMWMLAYHITRTAQRAKADSVKIGLTDIEKLMLTPEGIYTMTLAARWAEFLARENGKPESSHAP